MIKSFSGQVVFYFAILIAISAYVGENWLSQYNSYHFIAYYQQYITIVISYSFLVISVISWWFRLIVAPDQATRQTNSASFSKASLLSVPSALRNRCRDCCISLRQINLPLLNLVLS